MHLQNRVEHAIPFWAGWDLDGCEPGSSDFNFLDVLMINVLGRPISQFFGSSPRVS